MRYFAPNAASKWNEADPEFGVEPTWHSRVMADPDDAPRFVFAIAEGATADQAHDRACQIAEALNAAAGDL